MFWGRHPSRITLMYTNKPQLRLYKYLKCTPSLARWPPAPLCIIPLYSFIHDPGTCRYSLFLYFTQVHVLPLPLLNPGTYIYILPLPLLHLDTNIYYLFLYFTQVHLLNLRLLHPGTCCSFSSLPKYMYSLFLSFTQVHVALSLLYRGKCTRFSSHSHRCTYVPHE